MVLFLVPMVSADDDAVPVIHTISYDDVPWYADIPMTELAVLDAVKTWNDANNDDVQFIIVNSDADVNISWAYRIPNDPLGTYDVSVTADGELVDHRISIRLGVEDCNLDYQLFSYEIHKYTIIHELGHYLGLEHIDDSDHLMYSEDLFGVIPADVYDDMDLVIPYVEKPYLETAASRDAMLKLDQLDEALYQVFLQAEELRNMDSDNKIVQLALDNNIILGQELILQIRTLEYRIACLQM